MLNITRLQLLREVANRKTIAATAEAFFMTPSAVSQQLSTLEREAKVPLLEKDGRGVKLTNAGHLLVKNSEEIFAAIERAEAELVDASHGITGNIRLSAFPTTARWLLIPSVVQLRERHPNLTLQISDLEPEEAIPMLGAGELDVVVYYEWNVLPSIPIVGVRTYDLVTERVYLAIPSKHPLALQKEPIKLADLADEFWIVGREATSMLQLVFAATAQAGFSPRATFKSMDFKVILSAVEAGLGIALIPPLAFIGEKHDVVYKTLADMNLHRTVRAAVRKGSEYSPLISTVLAALSAQARVVQERLDEIPEEIEDDVTP